MENDGKIYIIISDKRLGDTNDTGVKTSKKTDEEKTNDYIQHKFKDFLVSETKQFINYNINNIGNFTGDYITQRKMSEAVNILGIFGNIGMAALAGSKFGVPGAVVAGAIAAVTQTINIGYNTYSDFIQVQKTNYNIEQLRKRSGLNSVLDNSRGTEN